MNLMNKPMLATAQQLEQAFYFDFKPTLKQNQYANLAFIPVEGLLMHRFDGFGSSYERIRTDIQEALEDDSVENIILDIDSGGGEVNGLFDLVDFIVKARNQKPITALVNEQAYSAAYLIASSASHIIAPKTAGVGSIGVIVAHLDQSEAEKTAGVKITEVFAGNHKVDFSPHQPLSDQAKSQMQTQINEIYELMLETLAKNRQCDTENFRATQAKCYLANEALKINLIDKIESPYHFLEEQMMTENTTELDNDVLDSTEPLVAERERAKAIVQMCKLAKMPDCAEDLIEGGNSVDEARKILFDKLAANVGDITNALPHSEEKGNQLIHSMVQGLGGKQNARV